MRINVRAVSPMPPGLSSNSTLACAACGAGFVPQLKAGIFVTQLRKRNGDEFYLSFCNACGENLADVMLLVPTERGGANVMHQAMRDAVALRRGYLESFDSQ